MQRMLEAAFDGDITEIKEILSEVSSLANCTLTSFSQPLSVTHRRALSFLVCANFAVPRPQNAVAVSKYDTLGSILVESTFPLLCVQLFMVLNFYIEVRGTVLYSMYPSAHSLH
jgi:hypothetical protein